MEDIYAFVVVAGTMLTIISIIEWVLLPFVIKNSENKL